MPRCRDVELLFTAYVDGEAAPPERATVDAHLHACPPCRDRVAGERAAREVLRARRSSLRPCASNALRTRCAAQRIAPAIRGGVLTRRAWAPLALAAAVLLAVSGALFFAGNSVEVLAAQLAVDHVKCFQFSPERGAVDPLAEARKWEAGYGWALKVPASAAAEQLELLGVRRCISSEGRVAHMMYRWRGQPLSVFVLNSRVRGRPGAGEVNEIVDKLGEQAVIWSRGDRTYAVVARRPAPGLQEVARYVRRVSE
jgi:anti-sigma factor RsiW